MKCVVLLKAAFLRARQLFTPQPVRTFRFLPVYVDRHIRQGFRTPHEMATRPIVPQRLPTLMKFQVPRSVLFGLFAFAAMGSASATQMHTSTPVFAPEVTAVAAPAKDAVNPWPSLASVTGVPAEILLAHDDRDWHDDRWHDRREDWRRDEWRRNEWRREQARREAERRRDWERHQDRAMGHRYEDNHRYYRR